MPLHKVLLRESLYHKVIYKITTDSEEIILLEEALKGEGLLDMLEEVPVEMNKTKPRGSGDRDMGERYRTGFHS